MKIKEQDGGLLEHPRPVVLGIDQSYTGFAITAMASVGDPVYHSYVLKAEGRGSARLAQIEDFLDRVVEDIHFDRGFRLVNVAMEGYAFGSQMANMAGELGGMVKLWFYRTFATGAGPWVRYPLLVPPTSLKKYVAGKGTGVAKQHMLLSIYKKWDVEYRDDNMADSYGLARLVSGRADHEYEKEVLAKLEDPKHREIP